MRVSVEGGEEVGCCAVCVFFWFFLEEGLVGGLVWGGLVGVVGGKGGWEGGREKGEGRGEGKGIGVEGRLGEGESGSVVCCLTTCLVGEKGVG